MNEDQIAADLAQKLPPSQPDQTGYPEQTPPEPQNFVDKLLPEEQLTQGQLLDYLQIPTQSRHDPMVEDYVRTVYQWARDIAGTPDLAQLIRVISEQEMHMGSKLKPDRLRRLAEYVKISRVRQNLAARERELYA